MLSDPSPPPSSAHRSEVHIRLERTLSGLSHFPHRGSTTEEEANAAQFLGRELSLQGFIVLEQPFESPTTYSWNVVGAAGLLALGSLFAWNSLWLGIPVSALGAWWLLAHFSLEPHFLDFFIPKAPSRNIVAQFGQGEQHLVLMAHYDTAKSAFLYNPARVGTFRLSFVLNVTLAVLTPILALARFFSDALEPILLVLALYFAVNTVLFYLRERNEPFVNGANDNASGVAAAIEIANRLWGKLGARVTLVLSGCKEVGARGAAEFLKTLEPQEYAQTLVLNLDNVGQGDLHYATGEGMVRFHRYNSSITELAQDLPLKAQPLEYRLAYFDTLPFVKVGVPCLSLIALNTDARARAEDGLIPHWHWPSDTLENVDMEAVERAADFAEALAYRWVHRDAN